MDIIDQVITVDINHITTNNDKNKWPLDSWAYFSGVSAFCVIHTQLYEVIWYDNKKEIFTQLIKHK